MECVCLTGVQQGFPQHEADFELECIFGAVGTIVRKMLLGSFSRDSCVAGHQKEKAVCIVSLNLGSVCEGEKVLLAVSTN